MPTKEMSPVWYLAGPFYQYREDVKALAKAAGLRIIDANVTASRFGEADPSLIPTVTLKSSAAPAPAPAPAAGPVAPVAPVAETVANLGRIELGNGMFIDPADLEAKAIELSTLTPGKFKQLKKAEREAFVLQALETEKAVAAAKALG